MSDKSFGGCWVGWTITGYQGARYNIGPFLCAWANIIRRETQRKSLVEVRTRRNDQHRTDADEAQFLSAGELGQRLRQDRRNRHVLEPQAHR